MTDWTVLSAAEHLLAAERDRRETEPLTDTWPELDAATGYRIQDELVRLRVASGEMVVGVKLGLTSRAKQERMGVDSPLTAVVTDAMRLPAGSPVPYDRLIHPRIEPEIVFTMARDLAGPHVTAESALEHVGTVHAGFEVIDSRFRGFRFRLPDVVADNASSSYFVVSGEGFAPDALDLAAEEVVVEVDGEEVDRATGAAVQGHPAAALALAANALHRRGLSIPAGTLVLTGGLTDAVEMDPAKRFTARFATLGNVEVPAGRG